MFVFFDLDDTLLDDSRAMRAAVVGLHAKLELQLPIEQFMAEWVDGLRRHYPESLSGALSFEEVRRLRIRGAVASDLCDDEADSLFADYAQMYEANWTVFPDVLPCLDQLGACALGVISNGASKQQRDKLRAVGIENRFQQVVISEDCGFAKPDPKIFYYSCQQAGVSPDEVIYVGDNNNTDVCGARSAGLRGVWLDRTGNDRRQCDGETIGSLAELPRLLGS